MTGMEMSMKTMSYTRKPAQEKEIEKGKKSQSRKRENPILSEKASTGLSLINGRSVQYWVLSTDNVKDNTLGLRGGLLLSLLCERARPANLLLILLLILLLADPMR
jgi:hypothetical protein